MSKYLKGQEVGIYLDGELIALSKSCTVSYTMNTEDVSTKDDEYNFFDNVSPTNLTWTVSNESFIGTMDNWISLHRTWLNRERVTVVAKDSGRTYINGNAWVESLSTAATMGEYATFSISLTGDGQDLNE